jgi:hypothetical protein
VRSFLRGEGEDISAFPLVTATTNRAFDPFAEAVPGKVMHRIGDVAATRLAACVSRGAEAGAVGAAYQA